MNLLLCYTGTDERNFYSPVKTKLLQMCPMHPDSKIWTLMKNLQKIGGMFMNLWKQQKVKKLNKKCIKTLFNLLHWERLKMESSYLALPYIYKTNTFTESEVFNFREEIRSFLHWVTITWQLDNSKGQVSIISLVL